MGEREEAAGEAARRDEGAAVSDWTWAPWTLTTAFLTGLERGDDGLVGWAVAYAGHVASGYAGRAVSTGEVLYHLEGRAAQWRHNRRRA